MRKYAHDTHAANGAAIYQIGSPADPAQTKDCSFDTEGLVIGVSEWVWLTDDNARRICAALTFFHGKSTEEVEAIAYKDDEPQPNI
jgi:hypothetical protein